MLSPPPVYTSVFLLLLLCVFGFLFWASFCWETRPHGVVLPARQLVVFLSRPLTKIAGITTRLFSVTLHVFFMFMLVNYKKKNFHLGKSGKINVFCLLTVSWMRRQYLEF